MAIRAITIYGWFYELEVLEKGFRAPLKRFGVDISRTMYGCLQKIGGPLCGCPHSTSPTTWDLHQGP